MKKIILIVLVIAGVAGNSWSQKMKDEFVLSGKVSGVDKGLMYIYYSDKNNTRVKDSSDIVMGQFSFKGNISSPTMAYLQLKEEKRNESNSTNVFIEPAVMKIDLALNDFRAGKLTGSKTGNEYEVLAASKKKIELKYKSQLDSLRTEKDHEKNAEIRERLAPYFAEMDQADFAFFDKNPTSYVTAYMMRFHVSDLSIEALQKYYDRMGERLQQTNDGKDLAMEIEKLRGGSPGSMAKNFSTKDINGNALSLADYRGKYVLIDFWASWCVPCRKGNPHLKQLYAKYKDKGIEFIGIADDDRAEDAWKKAVEKDGLPWKHVRRGLKYDAVKGYDKSTDISELFGIHTLPTKILIDPNGKIIGRFGEEEGPLDKQLSQIFGE